MCRVWGEVLHEGHSRPKKLLLKPLSFAYISKKSGKAASGFFFLADFTGHSAHSKGDTVATAAPTPDIGSAHNFGRLLSSSPCFDQCIIGGVQCRDEEIQRCQVAPIYRSLLPLSVSDPSLFGGFYCSSATTWMLKKHFRRTSHIRTKETHSRTKPQPTTGHISYTSGMKTFF